MANKNPTTNQTPNAPENETARFVDLWEQNMTAYAIKGPAPKSDDS